MYTNNAPESANLSREDNQVFEAARVAAASLAKTFELWITIARAVELARLKADRIGRRNAFQRILEQQGLAGVLGNTWNSQKSTANKLLAILNNLSEVETWRAGLNQHQRISWSAPTTVYKHCPLFGQKTEAEPGDAALAKLREKSGIDWNPANVEELRKALSEAAAENQQLNAAANKLRSEASELRARIGAMQMVDNAAMPDAAPVDGDAYLAALQSEIEMLKARIKELEEELAAVRAGAASALDTCSFCDKHKGEVASLIKGTRALICDECIALCSDIIVKQPDRAVKLKWSRRHDGGWGAQPGEYYAIPSGKGFTVYQDVLERPDPVELGTAKNTAEMKALVQAHADRA